MNTDDNKQKNESQENINWIDEASTGERIVNYLVDSFVCVILLMIVFRFQGDGLYGNTETPEVLVYSTSDYLIVLTTVISYYSFFEGIWGRTIGKMLTNTKVIDIDGEKPGLSTVLIRSLCRNIPFEWVSFFGTRGWHDSLSKTWVVKV